MTAKRNLLIIIISLVFLPSFLIITMVGFWGQSTEDKIHSVLINEALSDVQKTQYILNIWDEIDFESLNDDYPRDLSKLLHLTNTYSKYTSEEILKILKASNELTMLDATNYGMLVENLFVNDTEDFFHAFLSVDKDTQDLNIQWIRYSMTDPNAELQNARDHINTTHLTLYEMKEWNSLIASLETQSR